MAVTGDEEETRASLYWRGYETDQRGPVCRLPTCIVCRYAGPGAIPIYPVLRMVPGLLASASVASLRCFALTSSSATRHARSPSESSLTS